MPTIPNAYGKALQFVLAWEGGFSDNPHDKGGPTNKGVTQETYTHYRTLHKQPIQNVKYMTFGELTDIYRSEYWNPFITLTDDLLHLVAFNAAVNMGVAKAKDILDELDHKNPDAFLNQQEAIYRRYAQVGQQHIFLQGWLNRTEALRKLVHQLQTETTKPQQ
jgi:lysozyme family protein